MGKRIRILEMEDKDFSQPCAKFRKSLDEFFTLRWGGVSPRVLEMVKEDLKKWWESKHERCGCFYEEGKPDSDEQRARPE
jgi:hypothetical protein